MLEVVDCGSWWGLIDPLFEEEWLFMSGSYDSLFRFTSIFIYASLIMVALNQMFAFRGCCNTLFDIFEKLDGTKGVGKVFAGIITTSNDTIDDITQNSKSNEQLTLRISLST